jgi:hypothetical protein
MVVSSSVVAGAGAVLAGSSPGGPVQDVGHAVAEGLGESVEQASDFAQCQGNQPVGAGV